MITESAYLELLDNCQKYNRRLNAERKQRLPFLDPHTGVAQSPSLLWRSKRDRRQCNDPNIAYSYPARRWRKKHHTVALSVPDMRFLRPGDLVDSAEADRSNRDLISSLGGVGEEPVHGGSGSGFILRGLSGEIVPEARAEREGLHPHTNLMHAERDWGDDISDIGPDPEDDDDDDDNYDGSSYSGAKKKRKRKMTDKPRKKQTLPTDDVERPYICEMCQAKYKTKPGLSYHMHHTHPEYYIGRERGGVGASSNASHNANAPHLQSHDQHPLQHQAALGKDDSLGDFVQPSSIVFCDFCLGDANMNKKTNLPEELTSCSDCGRAGHPSCLQFTPNMIVSTRKYGWQCIECKCCAICGNSENDDQLLFCDDCDRGYHMYCVKPQLLEPPEGSWSCDLCRQEFGPGASNPQQPNSPKPHNFPRHRSLLKPN